MKRLLRTTAGIRMKFTETILEGTWIIAPEFHRDERGTFARIWCAKEFSERKISFVPVQMNAACSQKKGTLRGMHFQKAPALESKLIRCTKGAIFDVAVDLRPESKSFGKWFGIELNDKEGKMLFIPENCAHGYQTLADDTEMYYLTSGSYAPNLASGVRFNDPSLKIKWPLPVTMISQQDTSWPLMASELK